MRTWRRDILLILALIAIAGVMAIFFWRETRGGGYTVSVSVDGELWREAPLGRDLTIEVERGGRRNVVAIDGADASVRMEAADCPDGLCVRQGAIRDGSVPIVCLPNRVVVRIVGAPGAGAGIDAAADAEQKTAAGEF